MKKGIWILTLFFTTFLFAFGSLSLDREILEPDQAFKPSIKKLDDRLEVKIELAKDIYLYQNKVKVKLLEPKKEEIPLNLPKAQDFHEEKVFFNELKFDIPFSILPEGKIKLELLFQGCSSAGLCYPPISKIYDFEIPSTKVPKTNTNTNTKIQVSEEEKIASTLKNESLWAILLTFFGFGLLLSLTPCIFPMIPILSSIIVGTKNITTKKAFFLSLVYVLAMALTYTIAGVLAGLFGSNIQAAFQNPWVISIFALIFVALAFSMFGFYEIGLPSSIATKLAKKSDEAGSKGGVIGVAIMGFLSALIVGPCVAPPLAGALIYISQTGDAALGGLALFALSLGMGAPLLAIGTGAGKFMPKPGPWMTGISRVFGVVMLGVAIWMLERILPASITLLLWAALLIGSAIYLRVFETIEKGAHWFNYFKKTIGMLLFIYGLFLFFGAFTGANNILDPLKILKERHTNTVLVEKKSEFKKIYSLKELNEILKVSKKPVLLDFYADWCISCKELEHNTFSDNRVKKEFEQFTLVQADLTANSDENKELLKHFNIFGPPAILFFKDGKELKKYRVIGYKNPEEFLKILNNVKEIVSR